MASGGRLKIYLGYAVGVGKTYSMLLEAHQLLKCGADVVAGYIEPHERKETSEKMRGIETIPPLPIAYRGLTFKEADIESIVKRRPQVALIDEIAHTNAPGSKNLKRYEDVSILLNEGINVITTLNIQHVESLSCKIARDLGINISEKIPDSIVIGASEIVNIDLKISALISRIKEGKIFRSEMIDMALDGFFTKNNLSYLRKTTLSWLKANKKPH